MKRWCIRALRGERKLGLVLADGSEQAAEVASLRGFRGFYVEPDGEAAPTLSELIQLSSLDAADQLGLPFERKPTVEKSRGRRDVWSPVHGFPQPKPAKSGSARDVVEDS